MSAPLAAGSRALLDQKHRVRILHVQGNAALIREGQMPAMWVGLERLTLRPPICAACWLRDSVPPSEICATCADEMDPRAPQERPTVGVPR